jgi:regulator of sirC expression with transglutaminase-like and TPR domain
MVQHPPVDQLPYLVRLLDDESDMVREAVGEALDTFGADLEAALDRLQPPVEETDRRRAAELVASHRRRWLRRNWAAWSKPSHDKARLERGLTLLAQFQDGLSFGEALPERLDELAREYQSSCPHPDVHDLSRFLFQRKGLSGTRDARYAPGSSSVIWCLNHGKGLPVTLSCIYILVGHRLGLDVEGCGLPGHFAARVRDKSGTHLVDCHNGGRSLPAEDLVKLRPEAGQAVEALLRRPPPAPAILARVLRNLDRAYRSRGQQEDAALLDELLRRLHDKDRAWEP